VKPQAYDALLRIKYNSDFAANNDAYNRAENIFSKLDNGQTFEELAKTISDDKVSGQLGGDLGFVTESQILPELAKVLKTVTVGEIKKQLVVSRLGYHVIYPVETSQRDGQKVWHLKHILVQTKGYEEWVKDELTTIQVWHIFNI
jgi:parvulin-like peptidyl-prolyl isomerase